MDIETRRKKQQALMVQLVERKVRSLAKQIYETRGKKDGQELQDWFQAESEVLGNSILARLYRRLKTSDIEDKHQAGSDFPLKILPLREPRVNLPRHDSSLPYFRFAAGFFPLFEVFWFLSSRSRTAATMIGRPTVASTKTSPNLPPSDGGTNLPHEIASL